MTTIACDGLSIAADGMVTSGNGVFGRNCQKVHRLDDGRIVGISGTVYHYQPFMRWLVEAGDKPKLGDEFEALVLCPDGSCLSYNGDCEGYPEETPTATGSGRMVAIGAMDAGATAEEAVEIACDRDTCTGGTITVLRLEPSGPAKSSKAPLLTLP